MTELSLLRSNYGNKQLCKICQDQNESTEHILECEEIGKILESREEKEIKTSDTKKLKETKVYIEKAMKLIKEKESEEI